MKNLVAATLVGLSMSAQAAELKQFSEIADAVRQGKQLTFVLTLKECDSHSPMPDIISSIKPNAFMLIGTERVTASDKHFTLNDPMYVDKPVYGFGKYDIFAEGYATSNFTILDAKTYAKLHEFQVRCDLGHGFSVFD